MSFDFSGYASICKEMSVEQLNGALRDIHKTLGDADKMDRMNGNGELGGKYRDQASVIRQELKSRLKNK